MKQASPKAIVLVVFLCLSAVANMFSQMEFKGMVLDSLSGGPVAGAVVRTHTYPSTAVTDGRGMFTVQINYSEGESVTVYSAGYRPYKALINPSVRDNVLLLTPVSLQLEEVVVTATRSPKKIKDVPVYTRVINAAAIKNSGIRSFASLLENEIPGIEFTSNAGVPNIDMQGLGGNYVLVLVDGERLAGETRNNIDYAMINPENIERVEIVKGTSSTLYGSNAMGGVINIITKKNKKSFEGTLSAAAGSYGYENYSGSAGVKRKNYALQTNLFYKRTGSYLLEDTSLEKRIYQDRTVVEPALNTTIVEGGSSYAAEQRIAYTGVDKLTLDAKGSYFKRERFNAGEEGRVMHNFYTNATANANAGYAWGAGQHLKGSYNFSDYRKYNYYRIVDIRQRDYRDVLHSFRVVSDTRISPANSIVAGIEYLVQSLETYMFAGATSFSATSKSAFLQHDYRISPKLNLLSGLRLDKNSSYGEHLSPKIALKADFLSSWSVRASYAGGFRSPSLKELYTDWDHLGMFQIVGNPGLQPEKNRNSMVTLTYTRPRLIVGLNVFYNAITDKIGLFQNSTSDTIQYRNFDRQKLYGGELSAEIKVLPQATLQLGYSFVNDGMYEKGYKISTTRPHAANLKLEYTLKRENYATVFTFSGRFKSGMEVYMQDDSQDYYKIVYPAYSLWRLNCLFRYKAYAELTVAADNIFGYTAPVNNFYTPLTPGRTYQLGAVFYTDSIIK